ncbi:MAG: hypothetical protein WCI60_02440 [bacterium]
MANKGLEFEWCIYHLIAKANPLKYKSDANAKKAAGIYKTSGKDVQAAAQNAINIVTNQFGKIRGVAKKSGGGIEPKTDLIITTSKKLKCSLKYGGSVQLSSGGISNTVKFLTGVISNMAKEEGISKAQSKQLLAMLSEMQNELGDLGSQPKFKAEKALKGSEEYNTALQDILGSRRSPDVVDKYKNIKLAIVEEALTGKYTFASNPDLSAEYILAENYIRKIDKKFIEEVSGRTSVRLALKGRGTKVVDGKEVRLNEIVVRFDTK